VIKLKTFDIVIIKLINSKVKNRTLGMPSASNERWCRRR